MRPCLQMIRDLRKNYIVVSQRVDYSKPRMGIYFYNANCPRCGALVYTAAHPSTFKEVFPVERPYCQHCGVKLDSSKVELDPNKYCNSAG